MTKDENYDAPQSINKCNTLETMALSEQLPEQSDSLRDGNPLLAHKTTSNEPVINMSKVSKSPNEAQKKAIESNVNQDILVLAGPGAGKTFVIEHRYSFLVAKDVSPENILVCTFSKAMADEMGKRIQETCPMAKLDQISTIHAFCYRLLTKWQPDSEFYRWQVPKEWEVKKFFEETIPSVWLENEKPVHSEVLKYINASKYRGLSQDESYQFFVGSVGKCHGEWLYDLRCKFDTWLKRSRKLQFQDMLYHVEQRLKNDETWRTSLQGQFSHVIIDEAQDTNYQAMRILITISLKPGQNAVYEMEKK